MSKNQIGFDFVMFTFHKSPICSEKKGPTLWIDGCSEDPYAPGWCELERGKVEALRDFLNEHFPKETP